MVDIAVRLMDAAGQENCDSEEYDLMQEGAKRIRTLEQQLSVLKAAAGQVVHKEMHDIEMGNSMDNLAAILGDENGRD